MQGGILVLLTTPESQFCLLDQKLKGTKQNSLYPRSSLVFINEVAIKGSGKMGASIYPSLLSLILKTIDKQVKLSETASEIFCVPIHLATRNIQFFFM